MQVLTKSVLGLNKQPSMEGATNIEGCPRKSVQVLEQAVRESVAAMELDEDQGFVVAPMDPDHNKAGGEYWHGLILIPYRKTPEEIETFGAPEIAGIHGINAVATLLDYAVAHFHETLFAYAPMSTKSDYGDGFVYSLFESPRVFHNQRKSRG